MSTYDLVIRGGIVLDGLGTEPRVMDIAVRDGKIAAIGSVSESGTEEIDATGLFVTPGFVDIHTHYDGQVTWENRLLPSSGHGVTTVVMGNCGVGFAPCRAEDRKALIGLMEGVEDIPELVMSTGLPWNWETFPQYLDAVGRGSYDIDVAAYLPHSCLRVYVMGQRGIDREEAAPEDLIEMKRLTTEAMRAGALGFATSRSVFHRDNTGKPIPTKDIGKAELHAIGAGMREAGHGVIEALFDFDELDDEFGMLRDVVEQNDLALTFTVAELLDHPNEWRDALELTAKANAEGVNVKPQVFGRPTGLLLSLDHSFNPFSLYPSYREIAALPLSDRTREMRKPEVRARILADKPEGAKLKLLEYLHAFSRMFVLSETPDYAQPLEDSVAAQAERADVSPLELVYDILLERGGKSILFVTTANYVHGNLDAVGVMLNHKDTLLGLGDGGAHYGVICDAGYPTFMLTYWGRDKEGDRLAPERIVQKLSQETARFVGLNDRGTLEIGKKADINLIDFVNLHLHPPAPLYDLPAGGRRLVQKADGYVATFVNGVMTYRHGEPTGKLPGRLVRGPQEVAHVAGGHVVPA